MKIKKAWGECTETVRPARLTYLHLITEESFTTFDNNEALYDGATGLCRYLAEVNGNVALNTHSDP